MENIKVSFIITITLISCIFEHGYSQNINEFLFENNQFQFVDLTQTFNRAIRPQYISNDDTKWYTTTETCPNERLRTHLDGRYFVSSKGQFVDEIPLKNLILPLIIADVSEKVNGDASFVLYKHHLDHFLNNYFGRTKQPCIVIFKFGWSKYYRDQRKYYYGTDDHNKTVNFPGISEEVASWITTAYKNIVGVGVDLPSVDPGAITSNAATTTLITAGVYLIKNVKLDIFVPDSHCTALVLPMKILSSDGAPVRLLAMCPTSRMQHRDEPLHHL